MKGFRNVEIPTILKSYFITLVKIAIFYSCKHVEKSFIL